MSTYKITLLQCINGNGVIDSINPVYQVIMPDLNKNDLSEMIMSARQEIRINHDQLQVIDRVLAIDGHQIPILEPNDFRNAIEKTPSLSIGQMARYYHGIQSFHSHGGSIQKTKSQNTFNYRINNPGLCEEDGFTTVTVLTKDHFADIYLLTGLMVSKMAPAESILHYLAETTDGREQPVAAFNGNVTWALSYLSQGGETKNNKPKPQHDPMEQILGILLDEALVRKGFLAKDPEASHSRSFDWLAGLIRSRSVIAIETDLVFSEEVLSRIMKDKTGLPLSIMKPTTPPDMTLNSQLPSTDSIIVLPMTGYGQIAEPERIAHHLIHGNHALIIGCLSVKNLPEPLRRLIEVTITLPRIDKPIFNRIVFTLTGEAPADTGDHEKDNVWIQYVQPWDFVRVFRTTTKLRQAIIMIRHRVEDRLTKITPHHGPSLSDLHGLGEAKLRAEMLIADIKAASCGHIPWSQVDRGMLLSGPPGCGKTALARAIAKECGVRFVECSAAKWQMAGYLNDHLNAMARDFAEARRFEPSILFIDEIDSIGNRDNFSGSNSTYSTQVVNALLSELQGFSSRGKVIVIGATNNPGKVDPALKRAGRLDRVISVSLPSIQAIEKIFGYYLKIHKAPMDDINLRHLAKTSFGKSGADINCAVRGALRRARIAGRPLCHADLLEEIYERPLDQKTDTPQDSEDVRRSAIHEAGHAIVHLKSDYNTQQIDYVSIVPRPDGRLGFVAFKPNPTATYQRRSDYLAQLAILLGGRAAEEVFFGRDDVSCGAGGSEASDLFKATSLALDMVCKLGLGNSARLFWREIPSNKDRKEAEILIQTAYEHAKGIVTSNRSQMEHIIKILIDRQEISGDELSHFVGFYNDNK